MRTLDFSDGFESNVQPSIVGVDAIEIAVTPAGTISSSNVQAALEELDSEKVAKVSSTDNAVTRFDGTSGDVQNSGVIVDDSNNVSGVANLTATGTAQLLGTSNSDTTISIGTGTGANTINIGGANTTVNVNGSVNNQNVTNLDVDDKLVTINKGGAAGSGAVAGFDIEEGGSSTGYIKTSADRNSFEVKAPNTAGIASITPGGSNDEVALLAKAQTLSNKKFSDPLHLAEQGSAPSTPASGFKKIYPKSDGKIYSLDSSGVELEVGSGAGGSGGKNYLSGLFDGSVVTGINRYADAAAPTPVDGTGGSPNITAAALNTSTPLRGTSSQRLSKDGSSRQGEGWSYDFTVDRADYEGSKTLIVSFSYKTSSNYVANDVRMFVYDKDNSTLLNVSSLTSDGSLGVASDTTKFVGSFNTVSTSNDYRIIFHITSTTSAAWDLDVIDLSVSPEKTVPGTITTPWQSWTPTGSWVSNTTYTGYYRRVGQNMEGRVKVATSGAPTSATLSITLPFTIDTAVLTDTSANLPVVGTGQVNDSSTTFYKVFVTYGSSTTVTLRYQNNASGATGVVNQAAPITFGASDYIDFTFSVPISGWAATAALSTTETMLSTVRALGQIASFSVAHNSITTVTGWTEAYDTHSALDASTGIFTAPKTGYYLVAAQYSPVGAAGGNRNLYVTKNGTATNVLYATQPGNSANEAAVSSSKVIQLNAGDTIRVRFYQNQTSVAALNTSATAEASFFSIQEVPDFSVFSVYGITTLYPTSGYSSSGLVSYSTTAGQYGDLHSVSLPPGEYDAYAQATFNSSGVTSTTAIGLGISTTSGNSATGLVEGETIQIGMKTTTSGSRDQLSVKIAGIVLTSTTTYYLKSIANTSITNLQIGWSWRFRKVK